MDDFSDSLSHDSSSNMDAQNLETLKMFTADLQGLTDNLAVPSRSRGSSSRNSSTGRDNISLQSFGEETTLNFSRGRLSKTLPRNFEPKISAEPVTPPSE